MTHARGWWGMFCWNGLSHDQQRRLIEHGNLPIDYKPEGKCERPATVCIETQDDEAPGPRFFCAPCAIEWLVTRESKTMKIHKARHDEADPGHCAVCHQRVKRVRGGQGSTWIHEGTGAVAARGADPEAVTRAPSTTTTHRDD